jgi:CSLREA domain-containing protein
VGDLPITVQGVSLQGDFVQTGACAGVLAPKASCTMSVAFSPKVFGRRLGRLTIADNARGGPHRISLSGIGRKPKLLMAKVEPIPGSSPSDLMSVSPLAEAPLGSGSSRVTFRIAPNVPQAVGVIDTSRKFGWMAVSPAWFAKPSREVGSLSTAVWLVYMVPGVSTGNLAEQARIVSALANLPVVQSFASELQNNASAPDPSSVAALRAAYSAAVAAGLQMAGSLPARARRAADLRLGLASSETSGGAVSNWRHRSAGGGPTPYAGPFALDENDARFAVTGDNTAGVTVQPQWLSGFFGVGQGLYWMAAVYPVDTNEYDSFASLQSDWTEWDPTGAPPAIALSHSSAQPLAVGMLPANEPIFLPDVANLANVVATSLSGGNPFNGGTEITVPPDGVYALHLYTCGFAIGNSNGTPDNTFIQNWDNGEASALRLASCGLNISLIALNMLSTAVGASQLLSPSSCPSETAEFARAVEQSVAQNLAPLGAPSANPDLIATTAAVLAVAEGAAEALIPVGECSLENVGKNAAAAELGFFDNFFGILGLITSVGNLANDIDSFLYLEPWQGAYVEVGNPSFAPSPTPLAPKITSVSPDPVMGSDSAQPFAIFGDNFTAGANVILRDKTAGQSFPNRTPTNFSSTEIDLSVTFGTAPDHWSVEVINPDGQSSGEFPFQVAANQPPVINSLAANPTMVSPGGTSTISVSASDTEGDPLTYSWSAPDGGTLSSNSGPGPLTWTAPSTPGTYRVTVTVSESGNPPVSQSVSVAVVNQPPNQPPVINSLTANPTTVAPGGMSTISVSASDPEGDPLTYGWSAPDGGTLSSNSGPGPVTWTAPSSPGTYRVTVTVSESGNPPVSQSVNITVQAPPAGDTTADLVLGQTGFFANAPNMGVAPVTAAGLYGPNNVAIDRMGHLYVADTFNNRVLGWVDVSRLTNGAPADLVIGQPNFSSTLCNQGLASPSAESVCFSAGGYHGAGVAVDSVGNLYVADLTNNRILEFDTPFTKDTTADRVFGQGGSFTSKLCNMGGTPSADTLCQPGRIAFDAAGGMYVSDLLNNRVLEYDAPLSNTTADRVFGQGGSFTSARCNFNNGPQGPASANSLCEPFGLAVNNGKLYVADARNNRILEYGAPLSGTTAEQVFGQQGSMLTNGCNNGGISADSLCLFFSTKSGGIVVGGDLAFDGAGNLAVVDFVNSRVLEYNAPLSDTTADRVFGQQGSMSSNQCNRGGVGADSLCGPDGIAFDDTGGLYVADAVNNRVLEYKPQVASGSILVNTTTDTSTSGDGLCSLREAINNANARSDTTSGDCVAGTGDDTINFSVSGTITLAGSGLPAIANTLTIDGTGQAVTVDGASSFQVFVVNTLAALNLNDLTVANGKGTGGGGGVRVANAGALSITKSTFLDNSTSTTGFGGGDGGAIEAGNGSAVTVTNSTFSGNTTSGVGGAISFVGGALTVANTLFSGNSASAGDAIWVDGGGVTIANSTFSGNGGGPFGTAIEFSGGTMTVTGCTLAGGGGTAIRVNGTAALTVTNSTFSANGDGGIIADGGTPTITVTNSTFWATGLGVVVGFGTGTLSNSILAANSSGNCSGTIANGGGNISDDGTCNFGTSTGANGQTIGDNVNPLLSTDGLQANGGPTRTIALQSNSPAIDAVPIANCPSTDQRGLARPDPDSPTEAACDIGAFESGERPPPPPGPPVAPIVVNTTIDKSTSGDGLCSLREAINNANARSDTTSGDCVAGTGDDTINFSVSGTITLAGSGLPAIANTLTIDGTGQAVTVDGASSFQVFVVNTLAALNLNDLTVANGKGTGGGGGVRVANAGALSITKSTFLDNSTSTTGFGGGDGGAIEAGNGSAVTVTNSTFSGNTTSGVGGAISFVGGALTVANTLFSGNSASAGDAIWVDGGGVTIANSTFSGNGGGPFGTAIEFSGGTMTVTGCTLAGGGGTAIRVNGTAALTVTNSTFSANGDGGIIADGGTPTITVTNSTFWATGLGVVVGFGTGTLSNSILAANSSGNCSGTIANGGGNISDDGTCNFGTSTGANGQTIGDNVNPLLSTDGLQANGGPTRTIALQSNSPAIDAVPIANCPSTDQRGLARPDPDSPTETACDIGAFESGAR